MKRQDTDFPVAQLMERYGLVRSQIYARINALKAKNPALAPFKAGVKSYVNQVALGCLDEVHRLINEEGLTTEEAAAVVTGHTGATNKTPYIGQDSELFALLDVSPEQAPLIAIRRALQTEPLARYELLDKIVNRGWQIPTSELTLLLGIDTPNSDEFEDYGYRFTREVKTESKSVWRVKKAEKLP